MAEITTSVIASIIMAVALIVGRRPKRTGESMRSGHVSLPAPEVKLEITTSSNENVKTARRRR